MSDIPFLPRFDPPVELRLILACLHLRADPEQIHKLSRTGIDWASFLFWVDRHRVAPLVYQNLRRCGIHLPGSVISSLQSRFESNTRRSLANAAELVRLYKLFLENAIPVIPLKGSVLALQVYGNLALRHAGDIDLLVDPGQVEAADRLLQTGYVRQVPGFHLTPAQQRRFLRAWHHFEYYRQPGRLHVELHWRALHNLPPRLMEVDQLHSRGSTVAVAGQPLPAMSLPDNLLYLCGHGAVHFWFRLFWLADLAAIISQPPEIHWPQLTALAREMGLMRPLALGVLLAHELLAAPLPEVIHTYAVQDRSVVAAAEFSCRFMLCPDPYKQPLALSLRHHATRFIFALSFRDKLKILQEFFAGRDFMTIGLPDRLFFLYYFLRLPLWVQHRLGRSPNQENSLPAGRQDD